VLTHPSATLDSLLHEIRSCAHCTDLPLGPRPVVRASATARVLIIGQAPGTRVHETGIPWNDRSGDRLRNWLDVDRDTFYDEDRIAIVPMGFCYPGVDKNGGDNPPRRACAPLWHPALMTAMPKLRLTLLVGMYAQNRYLAEVRRKTVTETVANYAEYGPRYFPLPHPSWRTTGWQKRNPWFEADVLPNLRAAFHQALAT